MERHTITRLASFTLSAAVLAISQTAGAHTVLQTREADESKDAASHQTTNVYNAAVIGHGCEGKPVIANSFVFPDGSDSTIKVDGNVVAGAKVDDYVSWGGLISMIPDNDVFKKQKVEYDQLGAEGENIVGIHSWNGKLPGSKYLGLVPFRITSPEFVETSCAKSVTFKIAIADICKRTKLANFNDQVVNLWTPAVGSDFDGTPDSHGYDSPASYTVNRNLTDNPLPPSCGAGIDVVVYPSAAQINRDLPIPKFWPKGYNAQ